MMNRARIADDHGVGGNITIDQGTRGNQDIISDGNLPDDRGIDTDTHTTANGRDSFARPAALHSDGHSFMDVAIVAKDGTAIHGNVICVSQIKALSDMDAAWNLNPMLSRMKPEQYLIKRSGKSILPSLGLPE